MRHVQVETYPSGMSDSPDGEHEEDEARTGEMCLRIGRWEGGDQHHELIDIKVGETFPTCPYCGRAIGWTYLHE